MKRITAIGILTFFLCLHAIAQSSYELLVTGIEDDLHDIFPLNDREIWAYTYGTGLVYHSADSGKTWQKIAQLDSVFYEQMYFFDSDTGYIIGMHSVLRTNDGGKTWKNLDPARNNKLFYYSMYFETPEKGFVSGFRIKDSLAIPSVYHTINGGQSWSERPSATYDVLFGTSPYTGNTCIVGGKNTIIRINEWPAKWDTLYTDTTKRVVQIRALQAFGEHTIYACSYSGVFIRKIQGEWKNTIFPYSRFRSLYFADEKQGWITGDKTSNSNRFPVFETRDGGETWQGMMPELISLHRVRASEHYVWFAGRNGRIARMPKPLR